MKKLLIFKNNRMDFIRKCKLKLPKKNYSYPFNESQINLYHMSLLQTPFLFDLILRHFLKDV